MPCIDEPISVEGNSNAMVRPDGEVGINLGAQSKAIENNGFEITGSYGESQYGVTAHYSEIDSKLLNKYRGEMPILASKAVGQHHSSCRRLSNATRSKIQMRRRTDLVSKAASRPGIYSIVCYGKRSNLKRSASRSHAKAGALATSGAQHG
jgi:hypothetical protein